ncbi:MAG: type II toxin-antitoxin system VapC family toxin [Gemmatimonadaceae bacterium]
MPKAGFLLDTNIISELRKPRRSAAVVEWIGAIDDDRLYISVITIGEITKGIAQRRRTAGGVKDADALQAWLEGLLTTYADRIIPIDMPIAARWGRLCDLHPQLATDMLLAATALDRHLTVATRNTEHFQAAGVPVFNPFS